MSPKTPLNPSKMSLLGRPGEVLKRMSLSGPYFGVLGAAGGSILDPNGQQNGLKKRAEKTYVFKTLSKQLFQSLGPPFWEVLGLIFGTFWDAGEYVKNVLGLEREPFPASLEGSKNHTFFT